MAMVYPACGAPSRFEPSAPETGFGESRSGLRCAPRGARLGVVAAPQTLFITGIGGFIGSRLAERALKEGWSVHGIDQDHDAVERARRLGAYAEVGSVEDDGLLARLLRGARVVVHTAAIVRESGPLLEFRRINVGGTVCVARAARAAGVDTFVHLSSVMVYGFDYPKLVDEQGPRRGDGNAYCQTKIESEDAVLPLNEPSRFGVIVIRPGDVYGAGSVPWVIRPVSMMLRGMFLLPGRGRGIINHVYVDNLIDAVLLAVKKRAFGRAFNVTDGVATTNAEYFGRLAQLAGLKPPRNAPAALLEGIGAATALARRVGLTEQPLSADSVRYLMRPHAYSIERARRELGYEPRVDLDQGLERIRPAIRALVARG
jgi:nucleoside-diphosphate-sugar epimerase